MKFMRASAEDTSYDWTEPSSWNFQSLSLKHLFCGLFFFDKFLWPFLARAYVCRNSSCIFEEGSLPNDENKKIVVQKSDIFEPGWRNATEGLRLTTLLLLLLFVKKKYCG